MPNGRPGDHPFTDILHYGRSEFGEPVDGFVKHLATLPGFSEVAEEVSAVLWEASPMGRQSQRDELVAQAMEELSRIAERLHTAELRVEPIATLDRTRRTTSPVTAMLVVLLVALGLLLGGAASWLVSGLTTSEGNAFGPAFLIIGGPFLLIALLVWRSRNR